MSDLSASDGDAMVGASREPSVDLLRQAIGHVDQLLERLDRESPHPADPVPSAQPVAHPGLAQDGAPASRLAAAMAELSDAAGPQAQIVAEAVRLSLLAREAAEHMRAQARRASVDATAKGQRLVSEAVRAAQDLQADAERNWIECEAWANEQSRAADDAISALLVGSAPDPKRASADVHDADAASDRGGDVEDIVDAAVREMDALRIGRRRRLADRR